MLMASLLSQGQRELVSHSSGAVRVLGSAQNSSSGGRVPFPYLFSPSIPHQLRSSLGEGGSCLPLPLSWAEPSPHTTQLQQETSSPCTQDNKNTPAAGGGRDIPLSIEGKGGGNYYFLWGLSHWLILLPHG